MLGFGVLRGNKERESGAEREGEELGFGAGSSYPRRGSVGRGRGRGSRGSELGVLARSLQRRGEDDRDDFAQNPLEILIPFYSGPFPFLISVLLLKHVVKYLNEGPNKFRNL